MAGQRRQGGRRADLVGDEALDLAGRIGQHAATEAPEVGEAGVGAHRHAARLGEAEGLGHDFGVAGVQAAGDVGRGDHAEQGGVVADAIGAETFAEIGIEIDGAEKCHRGGSGWSGSV